MRTFRRGDLALLVAALALVLLPSPCVGYIQGDMDDDNDVSLSDAILIMKFMSKMSLPHALQKEVGVGGDPRIGLDDLIYVLQVISSLRGKNSSPTASFSLSAESGHFSVPFVFDASASSDAEGVILSYEWDFGDGGSASGASASHVYGVPGTVIVARSVIGGNVWITASVPPDTLVVWKPPG